LEIGEMAGSGEDAAVAMPKAGKRRLLLLVVATILVLGAGAGAAAYFTGLLPGVPGAPADPEHAAAAAEPGTGGEGAEGTPMPIVFVDMPDLIVNLQSDAPRMRFLKLRVSLEVAGEANAETVRQLMPRVMDSFQVYLRALTVEEVRGAAGMQRLKEDLIARVNLAVEPTQVSAVLLKEMLVQ
jgi:flagellar FliL protein